jgi:plasmid stabilization system protein ParE
MALPVVYRLRVKHDLKAAFDWYEEQRSGLGGEFVTSVQSTFKAIELHPELFATAYGEVRRAIMSRFPFAVFYLVEPKRVIVLRVLHTARNSDLWPKPQNMTR